MPRSSCSPTASDARLPVAVTMVFLLALLVGCPGPQASTPVVARYEVHAIQTPRGPILVRFDTATGTLLQAPLSGSQLWQPVGDVPKGLAGNSTRAGRYRFDYAQAPSTPLTLVRLDTDTGQVWRLAHPRDRVWTVLQDRTAPAETEQPVPRPRSQPDEPPKTDSRADEPGAATGFQQTKKDVDAFVQAVESIGLPVEMRSWAVDQLGNGPAKDAVKPLSGFVYNDELAIARAAVRAIARLKDDRVEQVLVALQHDERDEIRRLATRVLAELRRR